MTTRTKPTRAFMPVWDIKLASVLTKNGWIVTGLKTEPHDVVVLVDGPPVAPFLYGQRRLPIIRADPERDLKELNLLKAYNLERSVGFPKIGFGRGAHMLNILNGGSAWQFSNNHEGPTVHKVLNLMDGSSLWATTNHTQIMRPTSDAELHVLAEHESTVYIDDQGVFKRNDMKTIEIDVEACFYSGTNSVCFQPSDLTHDPTAGLFFSIVKETIGETLNASWRN